MTRVLLVIALLALPLDAGALELGARVRVTLLERPQVTGSVLALPPDSLVVAAGPDSAREAIARLDIRKLEVSRGIHSNAGRFATIGAVVVGLTFGFAIYSDAQDSEITDEGVAVIGLGGVAVGALVGAGVGALIGSASQHERWHKVLVKRKDVSP